MSAALLLVPWFGATYDRAQLVQWRISADRLDAGMVTGINYPQPAHVSRVLGSLIDVVDALDDLNLESKHAVSLADTSDIVGCIGELKDSLIDLTKECGDETNRANEAEGQRDRAEAQVDSMRAEALEQQRRLEEAHATIVKLRTQQTRIGDALRTLADALREDA